MVCFFYRQGIICKGEKPSKSWVCSLLRFFTLILNWLNKEVLKSNNYLIILKYDILLISTAAFLITSS